MRLGRPLSQYQWWANSLDKGCNSMWMPSEKGCLATRKLLPPLLCCGTMFKCTTLRLCSWSPIIRGSSPGLNTFCQLGFGQAPLQCVWRTHLPSPRPCYSLLWSGKEGNTRTNCQVANPGLSTVIDGDQKNHFTIGNQIFVAQINCDTKPGHKTSTYNPWGSCYSWNKDPHHSLRSQICPLPQSASSSCDFQNHHLFRVPEGLAVPCDYWNYFLLHRCIH